MPVTTPPTITALPTPPDPNDRTTFNTRAYPWSVAQQTFATEVGAVATNVAANAADAAASATTASAASETAVAASNYKGPWSILAGALAIPASVSHDGAVWALVSSVADVTAHEPGVSAQWLRLTAEIAPPAAAPGLVLIATLTPTAAANVDALTVFSSTYDDYLILLDEVQPASNQTLCLSFANAGVVDYSEAWFLAQASGVIGGPYSSAFITETPVLAGGSGVVAAIQVQNANSNGMKALSHDVCMQSGASAYRFYKTNGWVYTGASVSGVRLYWASGANFAAQGTIRIYGYSKT